MWNKIYGHDENISLIRGNISNNRLPHALLFYGIEGIGKSLTARATAKSILCQHIDACGICADCKYFDEQNHKNFFIIKPEKNSIKIEQIRFIIYEAGLHAINDASRVCIIEDADKMTIPASNSLLKLLEDPPDGFYFILTSSFVHNILNTIRSRCQLIKFNPLSSTVMESIIIQKGHSPSQAKIITRLSGGCIGTAVKMLENNTIDMRNAALEWVKSLNSNDYLRLFTEISIMEKYSQAQISELLRFMVIIFRDIISVKTLPTLESVFNIDAIDTIKLLAMERSVQSSIEAIRHIRTAEKMLATNTNIKLTLEKLLLELIMPIKEDIKLEKYCGH